MGSPVIKSIRSEDENLIDLRSVKHLKSLAREELIKVTQGNLKLLTNKFRISQ